MALSITQKLTITQAVLTLCVVASAGLAVYVFTVDSLDGESIQTVESEAHRASQRLFGQLDTDILVEFSGGPLPFLDVQDPTTHWAVLRGDHDPLIARGVLAEHWERSRASVAGADPIDLEDGRVFRTVSLPFPKFRSESLENLAAPLRGAILKNWPDALYLAAKHEVAGERRAREIHILKEYSILEVQVGYDGEIVEGEVATLPRSLPRRLVGPFFGVPDPGEDIPVSWTCHDCQLIMVATIPGGPEGQGPLLVNRYGERFLLGSRGEMVGPTHDTALRLVVGMDVTNVAQTARALLVRLLIGGPIVWLLMVMIGWFVMRRAFSPVRRILDAANNIEPSRLDARLPTGKVRDELYDISETINRMLDRLEKGFFRERRFTGDVSHELRGPLANIIAEIDVAMSKERAPGEYREALARCRRYAGGLEGIVESLLLLTRLDQRDAVVAFEPVDIQSIVVDAARILPEPERRRVAFELWEGHSPPMVRGRTDLLGVLVRNLLENALRYSPPEERVVARVRGCCGSVLLEIEDRGPGIPREALRQVFDRFFRLDKSRSRATGGVGLGLSIVRSIARVHGGEVDLLSASSGGTIARLSLPAVTDPTADHAPLVPVDPSLSAAASLR